MTRQNRISIIKLQSVGIIIMGIIHVVATFTPLIADKLALLPEESQGAFTFFSLMCGALLVLGGVMIYTLSGRITTYPFVRVPYTLALAILNIYGILAVCYMSHNPFAWIVFVLTMGLLFVNVIR